MMYVNTNSQTNTHTYCYDSKEDSSTRTISSGSAPKLVDGKLKFGEYDDSVTKMF